MQNGAVGGTSVLQLLPPSRFHDTRVDEGEPNQAEIVALPKHRLCFMSHYATVLRSFLPPCVGECLGKTLGRCCAASPRQGSALSVCEGFVFSVDVAGFSLGSVYTDDWVAQLLCCGEAAAVWGFSASACGTKVEKKKNPP